MQSSLLSSLSPIGRQRKLASELKTTPKDLQISFKNSSSLANGLTRARNSIQTEFTKLIGGKPKPIPYLCSQVSPRRSEEREGKEGADPDA